MTLPNGELFAGRGPDILLPRQFDALLSHESYAAHIAGTTTMSFAHLEKGYGPDGFTIMRYGRKQFASDYVNCDLEDSVYKEVFGEDPVILSPMSVWIKEERSTARRWLAGEVARTYLQVPDRIMLDKNADYRSGLEMLIEDTWQLGNTSSIESVVQLWISRSAALRDLFSVHPVSLQQIADGLSAIKDQRGVQVVYGDRANFISFIRRQKYMAIDDKAIEIRANIPAPLVMAVIPLGAYEQRALGV